MGGGGRHGAPGNQFWGSIFAMTAPPEKFFTIRHSEIASEAMFSVRAKNATRISPPALPQFLQLVKLFEPSYLK